ncbi:hypothetical protein AVEN_157911-1 [Araneus ventricosus]|uniref:Uncharacterized protein n=1 Tax=Araneus ventricosus TaxID=182803 RepID=A0A4Y2FH48_ARAVE|nr:hypothetical protein AVEN_157911-1 [Araneus ventricosus]
MSEVKNEGGNVSILLRTTNKELRNCIHLKPLSYGQSYQEFRPRFLLFPIIETARIDVTRGLVSASAASRVVAVNSLHIKGRGSGQTASEHPLTRVLHIDMPSHAPSDGATGRNSTDHSPQVRTLSNSRFA